MLVVYINCVHHSSFIFDSQKLETTFLGCVSAGGWLNKVGNELLVHGTLPMTLEGITGKKKRKKVTYCMIFITFLKWQNYRCGEQIRGLEEVRMRRYVCDYKWAY